MSLNLRYYPFVVSSVLLALAGVFHSASFAAAAVVSLAIIAVRDSVFEYFLNKQTKSSIPEEVKKKIGDLEIRVTSIEAGIARRGF